MCLLIVKHRITVQRPSKLIFGEHWTAGVSPEVKKRFIHNSFPAAPGWIRTVKISSVYFLICFLQLRRSVIRRDVTHFAEFRGDPNECRRVQFDRQQMSSYRLGL